MSDIFSKATHWIAQQCGHACVFIIAVITILVWAATGPLFGYSDTWRNDHHYLSYGVPHPKYAEPRHRGQPA